MPPHPEPRLVVALGFVLVTTEAGKEHDVYNQLLKVAEVRELVPLFGEYDVIVKVEAQDIDALGGAILTSIRTIPGVMATKTLAAVKL